MKCILILASLFVTASAANTQDMRDVRASDASIILSSAAATTTFGEPTVSLNDPQNFRNGEYVLRTTEHNG
jgi:hypothetical protein